MTERQTGAKGDVYVCLHVYISVVFILLFPKGCVLPHLPHVPILCWQARRPGKHKNRGVSVAMSESICMG